VLFLLPSFALSFKTTRSEKNNRKKGRQTVLNVSISANVV